MEHECIEILERNGRLETEEQWKGHGHVLVSEAKNGHNECVRRLLVDHNIDSNVSDRFGWTALHKTCRAPSGIHLDAISLLIAQGADLEKQTAYWMATGLHLAAEYGHLDIVRLLLQKGANIDARTREQYTPVSLAAMNGHLEVVRLLVDNGANVNVRDEEGQCAVFHAAYNYHIGCVAFLLRHGAGISNITGKKDISHLREHSSDGVLTLLSAAGAFPKFSHYDVTNDLMSQCRTAIRAQLLAANRANNLFTSVPNLCMPTSIKSYLLFDEA